MTAPNLPKLQAELDRLSRVFDGVETRASQPLPMTVDPVLGVDDEKRALLLQRAKLLYRDRRRRDDVFTGFGHLMGEPAWDMLIELFVAHLQGVQFSVTSISIASGAPNTTALRCLVALREAGLIERSDDPSDGRRRLVRLLPLGAQLMTTYLDRTA